MAQKEDSLFLLEVLVDKVIFDKTPCFTDKDFRTCVSVECPAVTALEICDDDPGTNVAKSDGPFIKTFNNGKSCLFSLKEDEINKAMSKYPVKVSIFKSLPCGCLPTKILIGEATIDMTKEFVEARNKFLEDPNSVSYQALKDAFKISGSDGGEAGEIIMFIRISCFGKLIITKFQGSSGPNLQTSGASGTVDRSCLPQREFQSSQDPCVCGAKKFFGDPHHPSCTASGGGNQGICPPARDPFNSMPCEEPDDPCYCSGPKQVTKQKMACRNTDQYCLHVPKGTLLYLPRDEENIGLMINAIRSGEVELPFLGLFNKNLMKKPEYITASNYESSQLMTDLSNTDVSKIVSESSTNLFNNSCYIIADNISKDGNSSLFNSVDNFWCTYENTKKSNLNTATAREESLFGNNQTTVYMTLFEDFEHRRCAGTQATGSINKCLQFDCNKVNSKTYSSNFSNKHSSTNLLYLNRKDTSNDIRNPDIYFFGRKSDTGKLKKGVGSHESLTKRYKQDASVSAKKSHHKSPPSPRASSTQGKPQSSSVSMQTKNSKVTTSRCSTKSVTIKANPVKPCPAIGSVKGEMMATVSHIKIAPVQPCPIHGNDPCQGPKCMAASKQEQQGPVKVSTVSNARRGVFELVVRKMTGAPLARNELMLEWTPPPCRGAPPCSSTCPVALPKPSSCKQSKYKLVVCRSPCKPKCSNKVYKRASSPMPCPPICPPPSCKKCCKKPCPSCAPSCAPPSCISPCAPGPCCKNPCKSPCISSPCLRPCPVGRKRPRRALSHPRIKAHPKRSSPCANRAKFCPGVRCKTPMPCIQCCNVTCYPRKFCAITPSKALTVCSSCTTVISC